MSYHANVAMVKLLVGEIMPRVWMKCPNVRLVVVGKDPPSDIRKLADSSRIQVTGTVNDIRPFLWKATAAVVPLLYGAGIQNKILEAMATKTPVITTSKAISALEARTGQEVLVANDPDEFSRVVLQLIDNRNLRDKIGRAGLSYVSLHHSWTSIACRLTEIYQQTIRQKEIYS
jgi:glycosyltransferase involved in cell wall biosynthesis